MPRLRTLQLTADVPPPCPLASAMAISCQGSARHAYHGEVQLDGCFRGGRIDGSANTDSSGSGAASSLYSAVPDLRHAFPVKKRGTLGRRLRQRELEQRFFASGVHGLDGDGDGFRSALASSYAMHTAKWLTLFKSSEDDS